MSKRYCFVISPIGQPGSAVRKHADFVLDGIVKPALGDTHQIERADQIQDSGLITPDIILRLRDSDLVLADLSTLNPNVFYELAVRHAYRKPTIHIASASTEILFDTSDQRIIFFSLDDWKSIEATRNSIKVSWPPKMGPVD